MKTWNIDPEKTARENLWSAATFAVERLRKKYVKAGMRLTGEEWQEVMDDIVLSAVKQFMGKVNRGEVNMEYSFYQNVYSCVYSFFNVRLDHFLRTVVKRKIENIDRLELEQAQFLVDTAKKPMYILGAPYATGEIVKGVRMILIRDSVVGDAVLGSLYVGGVKVCDTLENKDKLIPCDEYNLNVSKSQRFCRMLPLVYNDKVPMRRGIRIHVGNSVKDTEDCILVGFERNGDKLINSRNAESVVTGLAENDAKLIITTSWLLKGDEHS